MSQHLQNTSPILIAGGGIGGLCLAIALHQRGISVQVFEQAPAWAEVGAGITLWPNALQALRGLGVADAVIEAGMVVEQGTIFNPRGQRLGVIPSATLHRLAGEPTVALHRAALHRVLCEALPPETIRLDAKVAGVEANGAGVTLHFEKGVPASGALLVGADGIHSVVREKVFPRRPLRYAGYTAWRAVVEPPTPLPAGHVSETWGRGARFGLVPLGDGRVYWFATVNGPAGMERPPEERHAALRRHFGGWHAPVETLIEATPAEEILHTDLYDLRPFAPWHLGRVVLLGDAAHPTTPNLGQGAGMAIESAVVLARCLATAPDPEDAFVQYEAARRARTAWITEQSWQMGRIGQMTNPLACTLRDWALRHTPSRLALRTFQRTATFEG